VSKTEQSKRLAYVLRHNPASIGVTLDAEGWTELTPLLHSLGISRTELQTIVDTDKKGRYSIKGSKIRANQGHSLKGIMAVDLTPVTPPSILYHGTTRNVWLLIQKSGGLKKMNRHHVHMAPDTKTAEIVANRWKGQQPCVLWIDSYIMDRDGYQFFISDNGVWMTDHVPLIYLKRWEARGDYTP
jgi:putative RNA 2'-phosphotransferase